MEDPYQPASPPDEAPLRPEDPHWSLAPLYLVFQPRLFFETFALKNIPVLVALAAWVAGMSGVIDRFEMKMMTDSDNPLVVLMRGQWAVYWGFVAIVGIFSGALYFAIGGWWYRVRLKWSGAVDPDAALARRVFLFAAQVAAFPTLVLGGLDTMRFGTPIEAYNADSWTDFGLIALALWSVYVSYRGVRTAFTVTRWKARIWFAILPAMLFGIVLAGVVVAGLAGLFVQEPDLGTPTTIERPAYRLEHPGNWAVASGEAAYHPDWDFSIDPPFADATIRFWFYDTPMDSRECVDETHANLSVENEFEDLLPIEQWGGYPGYGYRGTALIEGARFRIEMFCSTEHDVPFEILMVCEEDAFERIHRGFEHIETTFELKESSGGARTDPAGA